MEHVQATYRCLKNIVLGAQDWCTTVNMIQSALNEALFKRLGSREDGTYLTALKVMKGIKPIRTMLHISQVAYEEIKERKIEKVKAWKVINMDQI